MGDEAVRLESALALEVVEGDPPQGWNESLAEAGGSPFHATEWARHKCHGGAGESLYFTWRGAKGDVKGRALAIRRPPRSTRLGQLASRTVFDSPPGSAATADSDFVSVLDAWAKEQPALLEVRLGSLDARSAWSPGAIPNPTRRREYLITAETEEEVWAGMNRNSRRNVKRAQKEGMETRGGTAADSLRFAQLFRQTSERLEAEKGVPFQLDDASFSASLEPLFGNDFGHLYVAGRAGEVETGWFFIALGDTACSVYSGTTDAAREIGGNSLSLFEALCDLRRRGFARLNLGGAGFDAPDPDSIDHGLHLYKTRFGASCEDREGGALLFRPLRTRLVDGARKLSGR